MFYFGAGRANRGKSSSFAGGSFWKIFKNSFSIISIILEGSLMLERIRSTILRRRKINLKDFEIFGQLHFLNKRWSIVHIYCEILAKSPFIWQKTSCHHDLLDFHFQVFWIWCLKFCSYVFFLRQNEWKELKMTVVIILREAFLKNNSIEVIKCLKLLGFKCKNDF